MATGSVPSWQMKSGPSLLPGRQVVPCHPLMLASSRPYTQAYTCTHTHTHTHIPAHSQMVIEIQ